jgi:hypothetical protein
MPKAKPEKILDCDIEKIIDSKTDKTSKIIP